MSGEQVADDVSRGLHALIVSGGTLNNKRLVRFYALLHLLSGCLLTDRGIGLERPLQLSLRPLASVYYRLKHHQVIQRAAKLLLAEDRLELADDFAGAVDEE